MYVIGCGDRSCDALESTLGKGGLEPPLLAEPDSKPGAATNYATCPRLHFYKTMPPTPVETTKADAL